MTPPPTTTTSSPVFSLEVCHMELPWCSFQTRNWETVLRAAQHSHVGVPSPAAAIDLGYHVLSSSGKVLQAAAIVTSKSWSWKSQTEVWAGWFPLRPLSSACRRGLPCILRVPFSLCPCLSLSLCVSDGDFADSLQENSALNSPHVPREVYRTI